MIIKPVFIIGAPRSGTSLLQKILRGHSAFWSLPSESDIVWDQFCHPRLRGWESEAMEAEDITPEAAESVPRQLENFMCPARFWQPVEKTNLIWGFRRMPHVRHGLGWLYKHVFPLIPRFMWRDKPKRFIDKTASNCFRLGYVNEVFPDSKIIYPSRDGRNNINSLINGWRHPTRFFTYDVPETLRLKGYCHKKWKFVLPSGWRGYVDRSLEEVCAFQWCSCHEAMLAECAKSKYDGRVFQIQLERLAAEPAYWLRQLAEFVELPYDYYFQHVASNFPVVNSPDNDTSQDKWKYQNREMVESILPMIQPMMERLGYSA
jgi:hypothetical protein